MCQVYNPGPDYRLNQAHLIRRYTDRALEFLERAAKSGEPFFLYVAHNAPHVPLYPSEGFAGRSRRGTFGDVVEELDASVGELLAKLAALGIVRDTLVYLRIRFPFGDQHARVGAVRDGRWKLKLPQRGYPEVLEPIAKTQLFGHGLLLFDLETDPGEQRDVAADHPDVVARLSKAIETFEASLSPAPPVLVAAAPYDHDGWEKMWRGVAAAFAVAFGAVAVLLFAISRAMRRLRRRHGVRRR